MTRGECCVESNGQSEGLTLSLLSPRPCHIVPERLGTHYCGNVESPCHPPPSSSLASSAFVYRFAVVGSKLTGEAPTCRYPDDDSNDVVVTAETLEQIPAKTTWTLLLYLTSATDGCIGGETVFYTNDRASGKEAIPVAPETGMLLLHRHGDDCMLVSFSTFHSSFPVSSPPSIPNTLGNLAFPFIKAMHA